MGKGGWSYHFIFTLSTSSVPSHYELVTTRSFTDTFPEILCTSGWEGCTHMSDSNCTVDGESLCHLDVFSWEAVSSNLVAEFSHPDHLVSVYDWEAKDGPGAEPRLLVHPSEEQRVLIRVLYIQDLAYTFKQFKVRSKSKLPIQ